MQTCGLRAVFRGQAPPADSDPIPAQPAPDQEGHPPFPNPSRSGGDRQVEHRSGRTVEGDAPLIRLQEAFVDSRF